jgi:branched-chain amino acid transport system substrate-binding protein
MSSRRSVMVSLAALPTAAALSGCTAGALPAALKIGVLVPLTGPFASRGVDLLRGAQLAAEELNEAAFKIAGKQVDIEIVSVDDKGDNDTSAQGAEKLVADGVHGVIGPLNTPQAQKVIPIVAQAGKPHLFTSTGATLMALGSGNAMRLLANDDLQGRAAATFAQSNLRAQRMVVMFENTDYGKGLNQAFMAHLGASKSNVVLTVALEPKDEVTETLASKVRSAQADLIVLFSRDPHLKSLYKALVQVDYTRVAVLGSNVVRNSSVAAAPIPVSALYATATAIDAREFVGGAQFLDAFKTKFNQAPQWGAHYSYDAVNALAGAARSIQSLDASKLVTRLKSREAYARVVSLHFDETGEQRNPAIAVYRAHGGEWQLQMRSSQW